MTPIFLLVSLFCYLGLQAQTKSQDFDLRIHYTIHSDSTCNRIRFKTVLPQSVSGFQHIEDIEFNIEPDSIYFSETDKYALYDFTPSPSRQQLVIRIKGTVYAHDYATCRKQPTAHDEDLSAWLKAENYIDSDSPLIKAKAAELNSKIVSMQQSNPEAFQQAMTQMQEAAQKMAQNPNDFSTACQALDEIDSMLK